MTTATAQVASDFIEQVIANTPSECHLEMCIQCGTCGASCPSAEAMDHTPRQLFAMIRAGFKEQVLASNTPWYCAACYYCMIRCPQDVHVTDIMYTLKRMSEETGLHRDSVAPDFSKAFTRWVFSSGRAFELGLMAEHRLRHNPLGSIQLSDMALGLVRKGRMDLTPPRIKDLEGFKRIIAKARELEAANEV